MEFVFARGSGQPQDTGKSFLEFQKNMTLAAKQAKLSYRITDLSYEAVAISVGNVLGTYVSAGEAYSFGRSIDGGVSQLEYYMRSRASCANTYWVLAGYSQGAMVVANSLKSFDADKVVYVALFGDPKLYLPEGEGFNPPACRGEELSEYPLHLIPKRRLMKTNFRIRTIRAVRMNPKRLLKHFSSSLKQTITKIKFERLNGDLLWL